MEAHLRLNRMAAPTLRYAMPVLHRVEPVDCRGFLPSLVHLFAVVMLFALLGLPCAAVGAALSRDAIGSLAPDIAVAKAQFASQFHKSTALPFTFQYGGNDSRTFIAKWPHIVSTHAIDGNRMATIDTFANAATGLIVECDRVSYSDFPAVEWVVEFKNAGKADTPVLSNIKALDWTTKVPGNGGYALFNNTGSRNAADDYAPHLTEMTPGMAVKLGVDGGRSSERDLPFFNLLGSDGGVLIGLGWPGNWSADVSRSSGATFTLTAGQGTTHFVLHPGEEVRTPLVVLQWYYGSVVRGQNIWRRWMLEHNTPHEPGKLPQTMMVTAAPEIESLHYSQAQELQYIDLSTSRGLPMDHWLIDAGWYQHTTSWWNTGTWDEDPAQFSRRSSQGNGPRSPGRT